MQLRPESPARSLPISISLSLSNPTFGKTGDGFATLLRSSSILLILWCPTSWDAMWPTINQSRG